MSPDEKMMTLTVEEAEKFLTDTITGAMKSCTVSCPIPCDVRPAVGPTFGMIKDLGEGDIFRGVESIRHNHEFTCEMRTTVKNLVNKVFVVIVTAAVVGVGSALWFAAKHWVGK